ncbi:MAG: 3-hydroxyacyl-CoA dehydrogenase family protein, partial [Myxococcota bacterium]
DVSVGAVGTDQSDASVGVIGAGVMGSGIAQTLATGGVRAVCTDIDPEALKRAEEGVVSGRYGFERAVSRGKLSREDAEAARARLSFTGELEAATACDVVLECVPERLDLKLRVFRDLDAAAPEATILASNTSGFPITALAAVTERPDRVIGWHWASPPPLMRLAEIVVTPQTSDESVQRTSELARRCGKNPVVVKDLPTQWGFVANRIYFAMVQEAQRVVDQGVASAEDVNQLMVDCFNWPVGPFAMVKGATEGWKD